ncbi:amine oxidase, partial [Gaertneriomyces semiglobifer]
PLSVLKAKEIVFHPPLPAWKQRAIDNLNMGHFNKLVMVFERRFWPAHVESFGSVATPENFPSPDYVASATLPHIRQPTLIAFTSPPGSTEQSTIAPEALAAIALRTLSRIFPHERPLPQPKQVIATTWDVDPYARGTYSSLGKAAHGDEYVVMSKREDGVGSRMIWAGEHTEGKWPATVHGAVLSGMRAAREVADMLLGALNEDVK